MNFKTLLTQKKVLLADGAWGTELAKKGLETGECPELLNAEKSEVVRGIAASYGAAGSDIVLTNTFGGSPFKLAKFGLESRLEELNEAGVRLSKEAVGERALVFASIGPTGEFLAPLGQVTEAEMVAAFSRQVKALVAGGVDGFVIETMTDLGEIGCAVRAVREHTDLPVIGSMTFDKGARGYATMMGVKPDDAAVFLTNAGVDAVGSNCGSGMENMIEVARGMRQSTNLPLWVKPNAGMPELVDGMTVFRESPEHMSSRVRELIDAGANIVGGCCGSTPEHIRAFREAIDRVVGQR